MSSSTTMVRRRTLAKGALWATPAVMVASAAPAFASSGKPYIDAKATAAAAVNDVEWCSGTPILTNQQSSVTIQNIPSNLTVTNITIQYFFQTGVDARGAQAGLPFNLTGPSGTRVSSGTQSVSWVSASAPCADKSGTVLQGTDPGTGWNNMVTLTQNAGLVNYGTGGTLPSWSETIATSGGSAPGTYTTNADGTKTFVASSSGTFLLKVTDASPGAITYYSIYLLTVTLSDTSKLTYWSNPIKHP